ncbi:MAG: PD40 domain-containing protein [Candidatus Eisenbacteria sp.]|nr:PD40 domain-containing protein [Candidatus Eisenbacteria bacterium]
MWSATVDGSDVTRHLRHASDPDWHPTEDLILCDAWVDETHAIVTISRWSSVPEIVKLSDPAAQVFCGTAEYSPDGQYIVYERSDWSGPYTSEIWVMNSDGTSSAQLVDGRCSNPTWSPDGTKVAYSRSDHSSSALEDNVLWVVDVVTREQTQLTSVLTEEAAARLTSVCSRRAWLSRRLHRGLWPATHPPRQP